LVRGGSVGSVWELGFRASRLCPLAVEIVAARSIPWHGWVEEMYEDEDEVVPAMSGMPNTFRVVGMTGLLKSQAPYAEQLAHNLCPSGQADGFTIDKVTLQNLLDTYAAVPHRCPSCGASLPGGLDCNCTPSSARRAACLCDRCGRQ
jgi:hypothetical protein